CEGRTVARPRAVERSGGPGRRHLCVPGADRRLRRSGRMAERLYVGTRKGLFEVARRGDGWDIVGSDFLGEPVTAVLADGDLAYAALDLGHFGAKFWRRSADDGDWQEMAVPMFLPKPADAE